MHVSSICFFLLILRVKNLDIFGSYLEAYTDNIYYLGWLHLSDYAEYYNPYKFLKPIYAKHLFAKINSGQIETQFVGGNK